MYVPCNDLVNGYKIRFDESKQQSKCLCQFDGGWIFVWNPKNMLWHILLFDQLNINCMYLVIAFNLMDTNKQQQTTISMSFRGGCKIRFDQRKQPGGLKGQDQSWISAVA